MLTCSHQPMKVSSSKYIQLSRLCRWRNLLFFALALSVSCRDRPPGEVSVLWEQQKAKGVHIPLSLLPEQNLDSARLYLRIRLEGDTTIILGDYHKDNDGIVFEPLLPFLRGSAYTAGYRDKHLQTFTIPAHEPRAAPQLVAIYPRRDTLPVNLLKVYFSFSQPMRESVSDRYIRLLRNGTDTLQDVFLNLQPELWNEDRTVLTIWLDPGRIKRGLQPNEKMGAPLEEGTSYRIWVSGGWQDAQGIPLGKDGYADFITGTRDSLSPDPSSWTIYPPHAGVTDPLLIDLHEALDHFLLEESIQVTDKKGNTIKGRVVLPGNDTQVRFIPDARWQPGEYQLVVDAKLEDLAGNNLNKPFERNITTTKTPADVLLYRRSFSILK